MLRLLSACNIRCQQMGAIQQGLALLAALARRAGEFAQFFIKRIILRAYMFHCCRLPQISEESASANTLSLCIRRALLKQAAHFFQIGQLVQRAQIKVVQQLLGGGKQLGFTRHITGSDHLYPVAGFE